ncbi:Alpha/Beta hydrolase fold containing protein [Parasponia andersonii]|uniref:Alpha/Beta hydrolase fold containing protein n=1 Tax=Parasponia andersonii TaxID=3476 RepID=A0A2P5BGG2_PARAD|nr:Alpha/Beta hydrolase fold containing protein [Parasponia andersonii]
MENGVSSFNHFIHELSVDSDNSSIDNSSGEEDNDDDIYPASPLSHSSRASRASSFSKCDRRRTGWIAYIFLWLLFPIKFLLGIPRRVYRLSYWDSKSSSTPGSDNSSNLRSFKRVQTLKDHIVHRTTDRRRGVVEDLHLAIEIFIEAIFDVVHKVAHFLLSPSEAFKVLFQLCFSHNSQSKENHESESEASVPTSTLGENDPSPTERTTSFHQALNTDARTCQDVITELGTHMKQFVSSLVMVMFFFWKEFLGRDSRKAVYLQHGILDSSMGWVSNGVVGSPAFAAFDQGYDVFLGNFRGLVSREHIDKNISSRQYWRYSINEHGTEDIPAMIEKIHQVKTAELKLSQPGLEEETSDDQLYRLCAVSHSLGGAAMIMYVVTQRIQEKPHRLSRLVLLSPAGFHDDSTFVFTVVEKFFLLLAPLLEPLVPGFYIPTRFFRMLLNKLARDFHNYPAVGGLVQTLMSYIVGGDSSNWVGVLGLPHYNMNDMPGVSFHVALHLAQMKRSGRFRMYNYGNASLNMEIYGSPEPLDIGEYYEFIDIPVDLVAGRKDKVIRPSMVRKHYKLMKDSCVNVSYNEFEYAHLDFTFSHREELLAYVMSRLLLVEPTLTRQSSQKALKLKRRGHVRSGPEVDEVTMG